MKIENQVTISEFLLRKMNVRLQIKKQKINTSKTKNHTHNDPPPHVHTPVRPFPCWENRFGTVGLRWSYKR